MNSLFLNEIVTSIIFLPSFFVLCYGILLHYTYVYIKNKSIKIPLFILIIGLFSTFIYLLLDNTPIIKLFLILFFGSLGIAYFMLTTL